MMQAGLLRILPKIFSAILLLLVAVSANSQTQFWQPTNGPYGGRVYCFATTSTKTTLIGTNGGGIYRSNDGGESWTLSNDGIFTESVLSLAVSKDGIIYAGTEQSYGVYKSLDDGYTWQWCGKDVVELDIVALAVHPSGAIFAASRGYGIFRSTDRSESWIRVHGNPGGPEAYITCLLIKPSGEIFAGCDFGKGVFRSSDQGDTWQELDMGFPTAPNTKALAMNASGDIYAATFSRGLLRSRDNGSKWSPIYYRDHMTTVFVAPNEAIYFGTGNGDGVYRSQDNGATWELVLPTRVPAEIRALGVNAANEILVTYGDDGICLSNDGGDTWQRKNQGISATSVVALLNHPNRELFAGSRGGGIFRSSNGMD